MKMTYIKNYIEENKQRFLDELFDLIRIPSISSSSKHKDDMLKAAEYWKKTILEAGATQVQAFTVTAPTIRDGNGARWPLWEVIAQGGGYIRVNDLFPAAAIFGESNNSLTVFRITALDYDYTSNTLRINVDNQDRRLDVRLRRFGIVNSESINRG